MQMIEFNFTRRQSETSLCVDKDVSPSNNNNGGLAPKHLFGLRKPVQRSMTYTPRDVTRISKPKELVSLPDRFRWKVRRRSIPHTMSSVLEHINEEGDLEFSDNWKDRKTDMEQAIKWLRQELTAMKRQDKVLKKRLLDLEATIQHLRGIRSCPSLVQVESQSSLYSGASWFSLDDGNMAADSRREATNQQRDTVMAFRARMVAEFQKSQPNLYLQSRTVSLMSVKSSGSNEDNYHIPHRGPGSCSSSGGSAFLTSCSSFSGEDDQKSERSLRQQESLDSLAYSMLSESTEDVIQDDEEVDSEELKVKTSRSSYHHRHITSSSASSTVSSDVEEGSGDGDQSDCASYEDSTLTRDTATNTTSMTGEDNNNKVDMMDSLEDILTAVSTAEEREGLTDAEPLEFLV